ncbi:MAG: amidohydrolase family protein [Bryobacteraceae bacterium]
MIWDLHTHLTGVPGNTPPQRMASLVRLADRMGIERFVVFMGYPFLYDPTPEQLREQNDQVLEALKGWHHRAFGFVYLSPKHLDFSLREFDRCVRDGPMVGIKLWVAVKANDERLDAIIERAGAMKAVIFQHSWTKVGGNLPGESDPWDIAALARRHPKVPIICGHTGGDWELGVRAIRGVPNLWADLAGSDPTAGFTEMAYRELGAERIIWGSDAGGRSFASQLAKVTGADIPESAKKRILGENLKRMMTPILTAKGVRL